jgi:hypothetical protein
MTGGNGRKQTNGRRKKRFGNAGRHHSEVRRLQFGNSDEAIHDAPDSAEQADKRGGGANCGEHAHSEADTTSLRAGDFGET